MKKMKLSDVWEYFCFLSKRKEPGIITFSVQLAVWIVGVAIVIFMTAKEFYEKMIKKWRYF